MLMVMDATAIWFEGKEPKQRRKSCVDIWLCHTQKKKTQILREIPTSKEEISEDIYQLLMAAGGESLMFN